LASKTSIANPGLGRELAGNIVEISAFRLSLNSVLIT
jgi:hypothetical protein